MRRFRRLRGSEAMRRLVRETRISAEEMIYPVFVIEGENIKNPIPSMPGVFQYSVDRMDEMLAEVAASGIAGVLIFGIPKEKDAVGSQAYAPDGITQRAIRHIKKKYPSLLVVADVCLCEYTSHGHCGLVEGEHILNDETLPLLAKMSVTLAQAGADTGRLHRYSFWRDARRCTRMPHPATAPDHSGRGRPFLSLNCSNHTHQRSMYEAKHQPLLARSVFLRRVAAHAAMAAGLVVA